MRSQWVRRAWGVAAVLVAACGAPPSSRIPHATARLAIPTESFVDDGPFRVVFTGPRGESGSISEVTIAFSRPLRGAGPLGIGLPAATVQRVHDGSAVAGTWRWFGERTAVFWPNDAPFASATEYEVRVDPSLRAFDGSALAPSPPFRFVAQRPALVEASYVWDEEAKLHKLTIAFNQETPPEQLTTALRIEGQGPHGTVSVPFSFTDGENEDRSRFELTLDRSVAGLKDVVAVTAPSLAGLRGPLRSGLEARLPIADLGAQKIELFCTPPGAADERVGAQLCSVERGAIGLRFSKPVGVRELARHLSGSNPLPRVEPLDDYTTTEADLDAFVRLAPGKKYKITVKAGLTSSDQERLATDQSFELETADNEPQLRLRELDGQRDAVIESARPRVDFQVDTMNVPSFEAVVAPLDQRRLLELLGRETLSAADVRSLPSAVSRSLPLERARNRTVSRSFELPSSLHRAGQSGAFALATSAAGLPDQARLVAVTDLGLTTKWSPYGGLVWVSRLSSAAPVADARVSLYENGAALYDATTDAQGIARVPAEITRALVGQPSAVLLARSGNDSAFARLPPLSSRSIQPVGMLFTDRRLYRPGEVAHVKGIFRSPSQRDLVTQPGQQLQLEAVDRDERTIFATHARLDAFGSFSCEIPIPRDARLGFARVLARFGDETWPAQARFTIDEYRAVEMKLEVEARRQEYLAGDRASLALRGKYLFGAPLHDALVELRARSQPTRFSPPGLSGFTTDGIGFWPDAAVFSHDSSVALDHDGTAAAQVPLSLPDPVGPEDVIVDASVDDVSKAFAVGDSASFLVHPAELYVGLRLAPKRSQPAINEPFRIEVAAAGWHDAARAGVQVQVELFRRADDRTPAVSTEQRCELLTTSAGVGCELRVTEPGTYWATARATDSGGRVARAAITFEVTKHEPEPTPRTAPERPSPSQTPLPSFDQACRSVASNGYYGALSVERNGYDDRFEVGGRVHTCLRGDGPALLTQERDGVLDYETLDIARPAILREVVVAAQHYPSLSLGLQALFARRKPFPARGRADVGHPRSDSGQADVGVTQPPEKKLEIALETGKRRRPGEQFEVVARVRDGNGQPAVAQLTLWAVDEGVIELEPFRVPSASGVFGDERTSSVVSSDTREGLFWERGFADHVSRAPKVRMGGTSTSSRTHVGRKLFRPTAWFLPNLVSGADGVARARVQLPDNATTWHVFAVAQSPLDAFGEAEQTFVTSQPLLARPALPRFLREGDRFEAALVLDSQEKRPLPLTVRLSASGALNGAGSRSLTLPPEAHLPLQFPINATARGHGRIELHVSGPGGLSDDVTIDEEVLAPRALETLVISGETRRRVDEPLGDLRQVRSDVGGLDYRFAQTPLAALRESLASLVDYPYGCTEQLSSRLIPLLRLRPLARELGVALPPDLDGAVRSAISSLLSHQRVDGGFGFWQESDAGEAWLTVNALLALESSRQAGYLVPQTALSGAQDWLEKLGEGLDLPTRALLEDVLATVGHPREKPLRALASEAHLPLFARALLAHALAKTDAALAKQILDSVAAAATLAGAGALIVDEPDTVWRTHLSSTARTTALALRAFAAVEPRSPLLARLARGLLSLRRAGRWSTTQENAWALVALDDARANLAASSNVTAQLQASFDGVALGRASGAQVGGGTIPMAKLLGSPGALLSFSSNGAPLFYEAALRYERQAPSPAALEHGIHVARSLQVLRKGSRVAPEHLEVGDQVEVEVVLASAVPRELVVLDDPIPAGFEAVNQRFAGNEPSEDAARLGAVTHRELHDERVVSYFDRLPAGVTHTAYRLRVIAAGRFAHPPAKAECMYAPDVFGRSAAGAVEVR